MKEVAVRWICGALIQDKQSDLMVITIMEEKTRAHVKEVSIGFGALLAKVEETKSIILAKAKINALSTPTITGWAVIHVAEHQNISASISVVMDRL